MYTFFFLLKLALLHCFFYIAWFSVRQTLSTKDLNHIKMMWNHKKPETLPLIIRRVKTSSYM